MIPAEKADARKRPPSAVVGAAAAVGIVLVALSFALAYTQWRTFGLPHDEAFYIQGFYNAAHAHGWFHQSIFLPYSSILRVHLNLIYFLLLPAYLTWPSPFLLFLLADAAIAISGVVIFLIARQLFGSIAMGIVWASLFAFYSSTVYLAAVGFRTLALVMGLLALALLFYLEGRWRPFLVVLALAVLAKEDVALVLPVWGIIAWMQGKGRGLAACLLVSGVAYFVAANGLVLPVLRGGPPGQIYFNGLLSPAGQSPAAITLGLVTHSWLLVTPRNLRFLGTLLSPLLFLPILGLEYLVIPAAFFAEIALVPAFQFVSLHYQAPAIPFIFVAVMVGVKRIATLAGRITPGSVRTGRMVAAAASILLVGVICLSSLYHSALQTQLLTLWFVSRPTVADDALHRVLAALPPGASVAATSALATPTASREDMLWLDHAPYALAWMGYGMDDLLFDRADMYEEKAGFDREIRWLLCQRAYGVRYADQRFGHTRLVLARGADPTHNRAVLYQIQDATHIYKAADLPASAGFAHLPWLFRLIHRGGINTLDPSAGARWVRVGRPGFPHAPGDVLLAGPDGRAASGSDAEAVRVLPGRYRVAFYLKVDRLTASRPVAIVEVVSRGRAAKTWERAIRAPEFHAPGRYQAFNLEVTVRQPTTLQFLVRYPSRDATLWVDRIELRLTQPFFAPSALCGQAGVAAELPSSGDRLSGASARDPVGAYVSSSGMSLPASSKSRPLWSSACPAPRVAGPPPPVPPVPGEGMLWLSGGSHAFAVAPTIRASRLGHLPGLTLEAWVYPLPETLTHPLPVFWDNGEDGYALEIEPKTGMLLLSAGGRQRVLQGHMFLGRWTHVAVTLAGHTARLYVNGMVTAAGRYPDEITTGIYPVFVGYRPVGPTGWVDGRPTAEARNEIARFRGFIAGVRIWGVALGGSQLGSKMADRLTGREANLLAYWTLDRLRNDLVVPDQGPGHNDLLLGTSCVFVSPETTGDAAQTRSSPHGKE